MLSFLLYWDLDKPVTGLDQFSPEDRPPLNPVFQSYHLMVFIGIFLIALNLFGMFFWWRGKLFEKKWLLKIFIFSVLAPQAANQLGWFSAEVGRQPWIVSDAIFTNSIYPYLSPAFYSFYLPARSKNQTWS
jgi:cytochrome d ubiquinol oxidase subunit I